MMMKMNSIEILIGKNQEKKVKVFFWIITVLTAIYLLSSICYYVVIKFYDVGIMGMPDKPFFAFLVKWMYALIILFSAKQIHRHPYHFYKWLNTASFGVIFLRIMQSKFYFENFTDFFLLEITALLIIIFTNSRYFNQRYHIRSNLLYFVLFMILRPIIWTVCVYFVFRYCITLSDDYTTWTFHFPH